MKREILSAAQQEALLLAIHKFEGDLLTIAGDQVVKLPVLQFYDQDGDSFVRNEVIAVLSFKLKYPVK